MAELGIIASIIQIADVGLRLSLKLYTFGETVASADRTVLSISKDISLTSSVLKELGSNLEKDKETRLCSENAVKTAEEVVLECLKVFQEIDALLEKTVATTGNDGRTKAKWTAAVVGRFRWPFLQPKMQLLRSNLDKLKATLLLMLNVMTYARQLSERSYPSSQLEDHRKLIEDLARSKDEYTRKFEVLTRAIMANPSRGSVADVGALGSSTDHQFSPDTSPSSPDPDQPSRILYELKTYGGLVNRLLPNINAVEHYLEPLLGARIRDDIIFTHRREASRFESLHGRSRLRETITGAAWDVIESRSEAEREQPSALEDHAPLRRPISSVVHSVTESSPTLNENSTQSHRSHLAHRWVPPMSLRDSENETIVSTRLPMLPGLDSSVPAPALLEAQQNRRSFQTHNMPIDATSQVDTVPPNHSRDRSTSPTERRSFVHSDSMSEDSAECMENDETRTFDADFEVNEQDIWLPIANVARIMKQALPEDAKIAKEAKECMQECVSEFISFITSEAAEKCQQEKRKTLQGEDTLFAMTVLDFENYAEALKIYLARYRQSIHKQIHALNPLSPSQTITREGIIPASTSNQPDTNTRRGARPAASFPAKHNTLSHGHGDNKLQPRDDRNTIDAGEILKQDIEAPPVGIVDQLLLQWTSLRELH